MIAPNVWQKKPFAQGFVSNNMFFICVLTSDSAACSVFCTKRCVCIMCTIAGPMAARSLSKSDIPSRDLIR